MSKYNVGLKTLLLHGLSKPEFYGDLVYKFREIIGLKDRIFFIISDGRAQTNIPFQLLRRFGHKNDFPYHFKKITVS